MLPNTNTMRIVTFCIPGKMPLRVSTGIGFYSTNNRKWSELFALPINPTLPILQMFRPLSLSSNRIVGFHVSPHSLKHEKPISWCHTSPLLNTTFIQRIRILSCIHQMLCIGFGKIMSTRKILLSTHIKIIMRCVMQH